MNKRKFIIIYILYFVINVFIGYNLNNLTSVKKVDFNYEKNVNEKWEKWLGYREDHLKFLERDILKVNHYVENDRHFYNINIIKKFDEDIKTKDIKGLDSNNFYVDVEKKSDDRVIFVNRYRMFNKILKLSEKGRDKVKYEIVNVTISSSIELKTILVENKDYSDYMTSNIFDEYKNEINSLTKDDLDLVISANNKTEAVMLYIIGAIFLIFGNIFTNFFVFAVSDIDEDDETGHKTLHLFIVTNIAIYSSFLIIELLS